MQRHDDRGVINSRIIPMNSRERENGENGGEKRRGGRKEEISEEEKADNLRRRRLRREQSHDTSRSEAMAARGKDGSEV